LVLTTRAFVPPSCDRVASQQIGAAEIASRAASRNWAICASVNWGTGGIIVGIGSSSGKPEQSCLLARFYISTESSSMGTNMQDSRRRKVTASTLAN
jgi:hypothetical protein